MADRHVLIAKGSPRKRGNSALLADRVGDGARDAGAQVDVFELHQLDIQPCSSCDSCQESVEKNCIVQDDMQRIYPALRRADAVVIASPVYWFTISAQTKLFIDRGFYPLGGPEGHALKGKEFGLVLSYGDIDPFTSGAVNALHTFRDIVSYLEGHVVDAVYGSALEPGEIEEQPAVMERAYQLGRRLGTGA